MSTLDVRLLGEFQLIYGDTPVTAVNTARLQSLFAYLLLHRHAPQPRQHLAFLFWPDTDETQAHTNLRNLLHKLRHALPNPDLFLTSDVHTVQWLPHTPYTLDVADFEAALAPTATCDQLTSALSLYRGDLLPGCYDEWIAPERERLRQLAVNGGERLVGRLEEIRDLRAATTQAQRLLQIDPLHEPTYRTLMRLHALQGDRARALQVYALCQSRLQDELGVDPDPATVELHQRLLQVERLYPQMDERPQVCLPLVGRAAQWKLLADRWARACAGAPSCVILTGEAGIGKTRLAEEMVQWVARQGFATATARCYAAEGALMYTPVTAWLRSPAMAQSLASLDTVWRDEVARLLPELLAKQHRLAQPTPIVQSWQHQRFFEALAGAMLGEGSPRLLFVDNLQWADRSTLEWLHYLLRFDSTAKLLLLATLRNDEIAPNHPLNTLLETLRDEGSLLEIGLPPLNAQESAALARHIAGRPLSDEQNALLYRETEGNPLFVVETIRAWNSEDTLPTAAPQQQRTDSGPLPPKVHTVLQHRLGQLSPEARYLAGIAATIGREFALPVLTHASDQSEEALIAGLDELWQRCIVREQGASAYDFSHNKLREVAYNSLSAARRHIYHQRVAQALESVHRLTLDAVSGQIAAHYELAGRYEQAIPYYQRAIEVAQQIHANPEAIQYCRRVLALVEGPAPRDPGLSAALHERLGELLHFVGHYEEARMAYTDALAHIPSRDPIAYARLQRKIGNSWREQYRYTDALAAYTSARQRLEDAPPVEGLEPTLPDTEKTTPEQQVNHWWQEWIQLLLEIKMVHYWLGDLEASDELDQALQPALERFGSPGQRADFSRLISSLEFRRNRSRATEASVIAVQRALALLEDAGDQERIPSMLFMLGFNLLWSDRAEEALQPLATALRLADQSGDISLQARCLTYRTIALRRCEQIEETAHSAERAATIAAQAHMPEYLALAEANLAWVAWRAGHSEQTNQHGQAALTHWRALPANHASAPFQWTARWPLLAVALREEEIDAAIENARALLDPLQQELPACLTSLLERALQAWERNAAEDSLSLLVEATEQAHQLRYL